MLFLKSVSLRLATPSLSRCTRHGTISSSVRLSWSRRVHEVKAARSLCLPCVKRHLTSVRFFSTGNTDVGKLSVANQRVVWRGNPNRNVAEGSLFYAEEENEHYHQVLENMPEYTHNLLFVTEAVEISENPATPEEKVDILQSLDNLPMDRLTEMLLLEELSQIPQKTRFNLLLDSRFQKLCLSILSGVDSFTDQQFFRILKQLSKFGFRNAIYGDGRTFRLSVHARISQECARRCEMNKWGLRELFLATDFSYATRTNAFPSTVIFPALQDKVQQHLNRLSQADLVLFMYHCSMSRKLTGSLVSQLLERIMENIEMLTFDELSIVCLGLFKTNSSISMPQFLNKVTLRLYQEMQTANPVALSAVFKTLCKSTDKNTSRHNSDFQEILGPLLEKCTLVLTDFPYSTVTHIVRFFLKIHWMSEAFLSSLVHVGLQEDISKWRVKEISRFLFQLCNFTCFSENREFQLVIKRLLDDLRSPHRQNEFQNFPESLVQGLVGLSFVDIYDEQLTDTLFGNDFQELLSSRRKSLKNVNFIRDLFQLDSSIRIDRPDYHGNRLSASVESMAEIPAVQGSLRKVSRSNSIRDVILDELVGELVSVLGGQKYLRVGHLLPHYHTTDVEIRLNQAGNPIPVDLWRASCTAARISPQARVSDDLTKLLLELSAPETPQTKLAVVMFGPNCYHLYRDKGGHSSKQLLGLHQMKLRHLTLSGFKVIKIPYFEFNQASHRQNFLKIKLFGNIQEN